MSSGAAAAAGEPPLAAAHFLTLPPADGAAPSTTGSLSTTASAADLDRAHYEDLPLGLLHPTVLDHGTAAGSPLAAGRRRYLCYFLHRHLEFRLPEVESLARLAAEWQGGAAASSSGASGSCSGGSPSPAVVWEKPFGDRPESPFWYAHLPSEEAARAVAARSVLAKAFIEVWGEGETFEELQQSVAAYPADEREKWTGPEQSFKFVVEAWGATYTMKQQIDLIDRMEGCTNFKGPIDLSNPQNRFWLIIVKSNGRGLPLLADR